MADAMKETSIWTRSMVKDYLSGQTSRSIKVGGSMTKWKVKALTDYRTAALTPASGRHLEARSWP